MHLKIPYKGSRSEAVSTVKRALTDGRAQFADKVQIHTETWAGDTLNFDFTAQSQRISGTLAVEDGFYVIDAKLPLMLRLFEGRIEKEIGEQIKKLQ